MIDVAGKRARRARSPKPTLVVRWVAIAGDDVRPGDTLPEGRVLARAWGGAIGIRAWRLVVAGRVTPLWLCPTRQVLAYRGTSAVVPARTC